MRTFKPFAMLMAMTAAPLAAQSQVEAIADRVVSVHVSLQPALAYIHDLPIPAHDSLGLRSASHLSASQSQLDRLLMELEALDESALSQQDAVTYAITHEFLQAERELRICRTELWDVNHMFGWQRILPILAANQPVGTSAERRQALERWQSLPQWVDYEIANLRLGLSEGYTSPQSVVRKVILQMDKLTSTQVTLSPLYSPATRTSDPAFAKALEETVRRAVNPALRRYADFLRSEYLSQARTELSISANPDGRACYVASLRKHTSLKESPEQIMARGLAAVSTNLAEIASLTGERSRSGRILPALKEIREEPGNRLTSENEVLTLTQDFIASGRAASTGVFEDLPRQPLQVKLYPPHLRGSGVSSHYEPGQNGQDPAIFWLQSENWEEQRRSDLEILAFHEAYPGHHVQQGLAAQAERHPIARLAGNGAYVEGWGRYAEVLADELGIYTSLAARIQRRAWPARGMVADPGLHLHGWTPEQTYRYLLESGRFSAADTRELLDRMAIMPGQLTAYDTGGLLIAGLRNRAESALGSGFELSEFHSVILRQGAVPLSLLTRSVEEWIALKLRTSLPSG